MKVKNPDLPYNKSLLQSYEVYILTLSVEALTNKIMTKYPGLIPTNTWGELSLFYNPKKALAKGVFFCTLKSKDGDNDTASNIDRNGVFRFNFGISKKSFLKLFDQEYKRPAKGHIINAPFDFTQLDTILPHPIYGSMNWICILNPSAKSLEQIEELIDESYELVLAKHQKRRLKA